MFLYNQGLNQQNVKVDHGLKKIFSKHISVKGFTSKIYENHTTHEKEKNNYFKYGKTLK